MALPEINLWTFIRPGEQKGTGEMLGYIEQRPVNRLHCGIIKYRGPVR
jgi:hypothetical protein